MKSIEVKFQINYVDKAELNKVKNAMYDVFLKTEATHPASSTLSTIIEALQNKIEEVEK